MKKVFGSALVLAAALLGPGAALADVLTHPGAKVEINVPAKWTQEQDGDFLQIASPDSAMSVVFAVVDAKASEAVFEAMDKSLEKNLGAIEWANEGEATEVEINTMSGWEFNGSAKDGSVLVDVLILDTPTDKDLGIYWFTDAASEKKHKAAITQIIKGLKPAK